MRLKKIILPAIFVGILSTQFAIIQAATLTKTVPASTTYYGPSGTNYPKRLFISGHSLTDQPLPDYLERISQGFGQELQWNRQYVLGSSIATRSRGSGAPSGDWVGYRTGANREGKDLDLIAEFKHPKTVSGGAYDTLLITEQHALLGSLMWNDTVRYLRNYHDVFISGNPNGVTYFYEPWLSLNDKRDPSRWIAYERAASPVWQCVVARINSSLKAETRTDRLISLPAGAALADLLERAVSEQGLEGISLSDKTQSASLIVQDQVHLTALGSYYMALVTFGFIHNKSPVGAWYPSHLNELQAHTLQNVAEEFLLGYSKHRKDISLDECRAGLHRKFIGTYWAYVRDTFMVPEEGKILAYLKWARYVIQWHWIASRESGTNPFYFNADSDRSYWFPVPSR